MRTRTGGGEGTHANGEGACAPKQGVEGGREDAHTNGDGARAPKWGGVGLAHAIGKGGGCTRKQEGGRAHDGQARMRTGREGVHTAGAGAHGNGEAKGVATPPLLFACARISLRVCHGSCSTPVLSDCSDLHHGSLYPMTHLMSCLTSSLTHS